MMIHFLVHTHPLPKLLADYLPCTSIFCDCTCWPEFQNNAIVLESATGVHSSFTLISMQLVPITVPLVAMDSYHLHSAGYIMMSHY